MLHPLRFASILLATFLAAFAEASPPNVVLIISDDQSWTDYGFMGHPVIETPHLDRLAARSATFPRGYVPTALCRPSLMTLVTGLHAHQHGVTGNDPSPAIAPTNSRLYPKLRERLIAKIDAFDTLPELLSEKGYLSHQSGKWWEGPWSRGGFTHGMTRGFPEKGGRHGDDGLKIGREGMEPIFSFIDESLDAGKPFFIWYAPFLPHTPHNPPKRLYDKYRERVDNHYIARYYAMCEWFDETCGELVDFIDQRDLTNDTLFVYVGDNGWIQKRDGGGFAPRSKQSAHEGGTRQPIFFSWPGQIEPGLRADELCSSIDIVPTILAAAGARTPEELPGFNLLPVLESGQPSPRQRVFGEGFAHDVADLDDPEASLLYRWVIDGDWKLLLTYDGSTNRYASKHPRQERRPQLYHLAQDPHETYNLAPEKPQIVARFAKALEDWYAVPNREVLTAW